MFKKSSKFWKFILSSWNVFEKFLKWFEAKYLFENYYSLFSHINLNFVLIKL